MTRAALVAELAREIGARRARLVGIDGIDGAGKTFLADELADAVGSAVVRVRLDDFLNPPEVRYTLGRESPEGFFRDWDYSIWLEVPFEVSVPRGAARGYGFGSPDPAAPSNRRYVEGQRLYIARCKPHERATVVLDNTNLDKPLRVEQVSADTSRGLRMRDE
ncbi:MAG TPA: hypothetical protein VE982_00785 [Gaiellaceae bacterium]|nr:hypothetical protein [Gaiellaceae bacterium]